MNLLVPKIFLIVLLLNIQNKDPKVKNYPMQKAFEEVEAIPIKHANVMHNCSGLNLQECIVQNPQLPAYYSRL